MRVMAKPCALLVALWIGGAAAPSAAVAADLPSFATPTLVFGDQSADPPGPLGAAEVWQVDFGVPAAGAAHRACRVASTCARRSPPRIPTSRAPSGAPWRSPTATATRVA